MAKRLFNLALGLVFIAFSVVPGGWTQSVGDVNTSGLNGEDAVTRDFTPGDYHGVISANMASGDLAHELLVDFGAKGVWWLGGIGVPWRKVTSDNPQAMIALNIDSDASIEVAVDFGIKGLWLFQWTTSLESWTRLTGDDPTQMIAVDDDYDGVDELQVDFGSKGVWRYDSIGGWKKLTSDNPVWGLRCDMWDTGWEEGLWAFTSGGTYSVYYDIAGYAMWDKHTNDYFASDTISAELGIGDSSEEIVFDFASKGTWGYNPDLYAWYKLTDDSLFDICKVKFVGASDYELLAVFNFVNGLWMWNATGVTGFPGTWTMLNSDTPAGDEAFCVPFDPDGLNEITGDEEVAIDFETKGLWLYNYSGGTTWKKLTSDSPSFMVRSDLAGDGMDTTLICDFGAKGLWYYYGPTGAWTRLTGDSPD